MKHEPGPPCSCHTAPMIWHVRKDLKAGGSWRCRIEGRERARAYYVKHREEQKAKNRERAQLRKYARVGQYGLSQRDYKALLFQQGHRCGICRIDTPRGRGRANFDVDHDHISGTVRGLLCNQCNRLLANAEDDIERLQSAIQYLLSVAAIYRKTA